MKTNIKTDLTCYAMTVRLTKTEPDGYGYKTQETQVLTSCWARSEAEAIGILIRKVNDEYPEHKAGAVLSIEVKPPTQ